MTYQLRRVRQAALKPAVDLTSLAKRTSSGLKRKASRSLVLKDVYLDLTKMQSRHLPKIKALQRDSEFTNDVKGLVDAHRKAMPLAELAYRGHLKPAYVRDLEKHLSDMHFYSDNITARLGKSTTVS